MTRRSSAAPRRSTIPDHVAIVVDNYRWRIGLAEGEPQYLDFEKRLAEGPVITVPTVTLEGDANGAPHPDPSAYAAKFSGPYSHRTIEGGIGHNLPQEAPAAFADAICELSAARARQREQRPVVRAARPMSSFREVIPSLV